MTQRFGIAIIGAGFSGSMLANALSSHSGSIALIDAGNDAPRGAAYSTSYPEHVLNVPTARMGAFPNETDHFYHWVHSPEGIAAAARYALTPPFAPDSFLPRALYGDYIASQSHHKAVLFHTRADAVEREGDAYRIILGDGQHIEASRLIFATGNGFAREGQAGTAYYPEPWRCDFDTVATHSSPHPIVIIGTGLTAVDTLASLLLRNVSAPIILLSRHGAFPSVHTASPLAPTPAFDPSLLLGHPLSQQLRTLRMFIATHIREGYSWQSCIDALRPHTVVLWQHLSDAEQRRFFRHGFSHWNRARHRMATALGDILAQGKTNARYHVRKASVKRIEGMDILLSDDSRITASTIFDCRGPRYSITHPALFASLIAGHILTPHATGLGFAATDAHGRISAEGAPSIYAIGPLLIGARLETTAVPELRTHVQDIARAINLR